MKKEISLNKNSEVILSDDVKVNVLGNRLIEARELMNLTQQDIADKLCLKLEMINNIENDNMPSNLAPVFFLGYIRSYARLVNILDDELSSLMLNYKYSSVLYPKDYVKILYLSEDKSFLNTKKTLIFASLFSAIFLSLFIILSSVFKINKIDSDLFIVNK